MNLEELRASLKATKAAAPPPLTDDEAETARLLGEIAEAKADALAINKTRREARGQALEAAAWPAARAGKYLIRFVDLAALLPDADPDDLPGNGVLVVRSPPQGAVGAFHRELEAKTKLLPEVYTDLLCVSTVYPDLTNEVAGIEFRGFFASSLGEGSSSVVGDVVTDLAGIRGKTVKRGRG